MGRGPPVQDESRLSEQRSRCKAAKVGAPEAYAVVRRRAARPHFPFERGLRSRKLGGRFRKGGVPPSEESLRRRWAFSINLSIILAEAHSLGEHPSVLSVVLPRPAESVLHRDQLARGEGTLHRELIVSEREQEI